MKFIDILVIAIVVYLLATAFKILRKQGSCGCNKKNCPNKKH